ncbi:hypothetical protein P7H50_10575 [Enterococcus durans]|uniref:hypothetical protein n=1 Tax=Enterococcus durans TaxID=53345 RepID=UPI0028923D4B|nr:hypothetical protein [Enterococcus durans]MDT2837311.1 hypothetical protein [Enterococcus durans]
MDVPQDASNKSEPNKPRKRIFLVIGVLLVIVFSINYWLPRITLVRNHEATYLFPPSNKKFVSNVFYLIEKRWISELSTKKENRNIQQEMKKLEAKTYASYQKMMPDLTDMQLRESSLI